MAHTIRLTFTTCPVGEEQQYEEWYRGAHIPELVEHGVYLSGRLYQLATGAPTIVSEHGPVAAQYVAVYETDTDDWDDLQSRVDRARPVMTPLYPGMQILSRGVYSAISDLMRSSSAHKLAEPA
jgi:hypothetical protein